MKGFVHSPPIRLLPIPPPSSIFSMTPYSLHTKGDSCSPLHTHTPRTFSIPPPLHFTNFLRGCQYSFFTCNYVRKMPIYSFFTFNDIKNRAWPTLPKSTLPTVPASSLHLERQIYSPNSTPTSAPKPCQSVPNMS